MTGPVVNGRQHTTLTIINQASRTYSQQRTEHAVTGGANAPDSSAPGLRSSPSEVQQALRSGQATREGTTTVNGTPAIALSITVPDARSFHRTLYVDARTYQPLRAVTVADGNQSGPYVEGRMPATPDNIAKAKGDPVPAATPRPTWPWCSRIAPASSALSRVPVELRDNLSWLMFAGSLGSVVAVPACLRSIEYTGSAHDETELEALRTAADFIIDSYHPDLRTEIEPTRVGAVCWLRAAWRADPA